MKQSLILFSALFVLMISACTMPFSYFETENYSESSAGVNTLHVTNVTGNIVIEPGSSSAIEIEAVKGGATLFDLDRIKVEISKSGDTLSVESRYEHPSINAGIDYKIRIPATVSVRLRNTTGNITVRNISRILSAAAVTGNIEIRNVSKTGYLEVTTGNIDADADSIDGNTSFKTVTGNITVSIPLTGYGSIIAAVVTGTVSSQGVNTTGTGTGTLRVETVTGNIILTP